MKTTRKEILDELIAITHSTIKEAETLKSLDTALLNRKPSATSWSILECLEHLNRYDSFYLPAIAAHLSKNAPASAPLFKNGFIGNYLVNTIIPKTNGKKMKTFTAMDPAGSALSVSVITIFLTGQQTLLRQLEQAREHDLNGAGIPVTFSKLVKLKLGDALRFMVYHNLRHIQQARRIKL